MPNTIKQQQLLENVSLSFDEVQVFDGVSLHVPKNKITCIVGPSGCGKTTMLNLLAGFLKADEGKINTGDERIGYIFQEDRLLPWETVYNNVSIVRDDEDKEEIEGLLKSLEIYDFKDKLPGQLSGGMKQRTSIARGFYYHSSLLLMDEPFKSLDYDLRLNLVRYLARLWEKKRNTIVFVTHDIDEALLLGHQVIVLSKRPGRILESFAMSRDLSTREINDQEHQLVRDKIINHMTYYSK